MRAHHMVNIKTEEAGFASIVIAIVLIIVLSLTTVGFADLMRKEQSSALDKHLSSQAYYAAESGINDAAKAINAGYTDKKTTCDYGGGVQPGSTYLQSTSAIGSGANGVSYTCLLIDPEPKTLEYQAVDGDLNSKAFTITGVDPTNSNNDTLIGSLVIGWQDHGGSKQFLNGSSFPRSTAATGIVRIGLTPLRKGFIDRTDLANSFYAGYLYPNYSSAASAPGTSTYSIGTSGVNAGVVAKGNCNTANVSRSAGDTPRYCNVKITGLAQANYLVDLRSLYKSSDITIMAFGLDGTQLRMKNAQTMVDATGKAQDVLRRIQVRIPSKNNYVRSNYALETTDNICKQLQLSPDDDAASHCDAGAVGPTPASPDYGATAAP